MRSCACSWTWGELLDGLLTYNTVKLVKVRDRRLGALKYLLIFSLALYSASRCPRRLCSFASSATGTGHSRLFAVIVFKMLRDTAYVNSGPLRRSLFFVAPLPLTSVENRLRDERPVPGPRQVGDPPAAGISRSRGRRGACDCHSSHRRCRPRAISTRMSLARSTCVPWTNSRTATPLPPLGLDIVADPTPPCLAQIWQLAAFPALACEQLPQGGHK